MQTFRVPTWTEERHRYAAVCDLWSIPKQRYQDDAGSISTKPPGFIIIEVFDKRSPRLS